MTNFTQRAISGFVYAGIVIGSIYAHPIIFGFVLLLFALIGFFEWLYLSHKVIPSGIFYINFITVFILFVSGFLWIYNGFQYSNFYLPVIALSLLLPLLVLLKFEKKWMISIYSGLLYAVFTFIIINQLYFIESHPKFTTKYLVALFIGIWINDSMAYLVGKNIGKTKLAAKISPKKTWEGFAGGGIFTVLICLFVYPIWPGLNVIDSVAIGFIAFIFGTLGDLLQSYFKRKANVKDSGNIIPGHGGILDRLDSIIVAGPIFVIYLSIVNKLL